MRKLQLLFIVFSDFKKYNQNHDSLLRTGSSEIKKRIKVNK